MSAAKRVSVASSLANALRRLVPTARGNQARWIAGVAIVGGFVALVVAMWRNWGGELVGSHRYELSEQSLLITPQPEWIHGSTNVKAEVIRDGSLEQLNLLDEQAAVKIARAFELHTWVRRVVRVQKRPPASVVVDLEYRRPVALVEVVYNNVLSYEPVDSEGVVLPEDLFHAEEKQLGNYLRITTDYSLPTGPLGTPWGDERILGAARIAALLEQAWREWQIFRIATVPSVELEQRPIFELRTRGQTRILWGHAPGQEEPGETAALQKVLWLADYVQHHGPFGSDADRSLQLDLRQLTDPEPPARTAGRPR